MLAATALDGRVAPRPSDLWTDAEGLHCTESLDIDHWPDTLGDQTNGPAGAQEVLQLALALGRQLQVLELHGIVHGRIEPRRVRWAPASAQVWLTDFDHGGFVRALGDPVAQQALARGGDLRALGRLLAWQVSGQTHWLASAASDDLPAGQRDPTLALSDHPLLAEIIRGLLAAGTPEGYQSARAVCEELVAARIRARPGGLGRPTRWHLPIRRIGRGDAMETVVQAHAAVVRAATTGPATSVERTGAVFVVVDGRSGIGKTTLVQAACLRLQAQGTRVASGKFNQYGHHAPASALLDAIGQALLDVSSQPAALRQAIAHRVHLQLGALADALVTALPELSRLIGSVPPPPQLTEEARRTRFELALQRLVAALCDRENPLVLFIDDLQWADERTLALLAGLLSEPLMHGLVVLGAFRSEAPEATHCLLPWLQRLQDEPGIDLRRASVTPWDVDDVTELLHAAGVAAGDHVPQAAQALVRHSGGNPLMILQLLRGAEQAKAIVPAADGPGWHLHGVQLLQMLEGPDLTELVRAQIQRLPESARAALSDAAHLGAAWSIEALAAAHGNTVLHTCRMLAPALADGLVLLLDDGAGPGQALSLRFLHDVIQQAAYERVAANQRAALRFRLGSGLLQHAQDQGRLDAYLFTIVDQFNAVASDPQNAAQADLTADLNLRAGRLASSQGFSEDALSYFLKAMGYRRPAHATMDEGTDPDAPPDVDLYCQAAEAACVSARFEVADELLLQAQALGADPLGSARIAELRVLALLARNRLTEALSVGEAALHSVGVPLRTMDDPASWTGVPELAQLDLSGGSSPLHDSAQRLLVALTPCAFITSFELYARVIRTMIGLAQDWPASELTPLAWTNYGLTLCGMERRDEAFRASSLALAMSAQAPTPALRCKVQVLSFGFLRHWQEPVTQQLAPMLQAYEDCLVYGDQEYLGYAAFLYCDKAFGLAPLDALIVGHTQRLATVKQFGHDFSYHHCRVWLQGLQSLRGDPSARALSLEGASFREGQDLSSLEAARNSFSLFTAHALRAILAWHRGDQAACWQACQQAQALAANGTGTLLSVDVLTLCALTGPAGPAEEARNRLAAWARLVPVNIGHKLALVDAVLASRQGQLGQALALFERARDGARDGGFLRDQLMAEQACSEALADAGDLAHAQEWFAQAWATGLRWGALAVVERLLARHAERMARLGRPAASTNPDPQTVASERQGQAAFDLAKVSHDMRNPLNGVLGLTSLLLTSDLDERQRRLARLTQSSAESLLLMVNDIMDLAELERGQLRLRNGPVDLRSLAEELQAVHQMPRLKGSLDLLLHVDPALPRHITADGQRLRQVMGNLLSNALKFTRQGQVSMHLLCEPVSAPTTIRVQVDDTGAGISEEEQGRLFDAFYQTSTGTAYRGPSSGLGLAVSKAIVEAMGGEVGLRSTPGQGSSFWFTLPLRPCAGPA